MQHLIYTATAPDSCETVQLIILAMRVLFTLMLLLEAMLRMEYTERSSILNAGPRPRGGYTTVWLMQPDSCTLGESGQLPGSALYTKQSM